jgi:hypothetical protein
MSQTDFYKDIVQSEWNLLKVVVPFVRWLQKSTVMSNIYYIAIL